MEKSAEWCYLCIRFRPGGVRMKKKEFFKEIGRFEDAASGIRYIDAGDWSGKENKKNNNRIYEDLNTMKSLILAQDER